MKKNVYCSLITIKNAQISKKSVVFIKKSKKIEIILKLLWFENFILGYKTINKNVKVFLKYSNSCLPSISFLKFISLKKTKDIHFSKEKIWKIINKNFFYLFSTNLGLKTLKGCKKNNVGGKLVLILK
jgi:ribosomal protein S8